MAGFSLKSTLSQQINSQICWQQNLIYRQKSNNQSWRHFKVIFLLPISQNSIVRIAAKLKDTNFY